MTKQYNLHSVRIDDEVWAQAKASGISVNQLLRRALGLAYAQTRKVEPVVGDTVTRDTEPPIIVAPKPRYERKPLLKPSQRGAK